MLQVIRRKKGFKEVHHPECATPQWVDCTWSGDTTGVNAGAMLKKLSNPAICVFLRPKLPCREGVVSASRLNVECTPVEGNVQWSSRSSPADGDYMGEDHRKRNIISI